MPEALSNRNSDQPNFEVKRRDVREEAARISKKTTEVKTEDDIQVRTAKNTQVREEIRSAAEQEKRDNLEKVRLQQGQVTIDKRRAQDKANPDSGNIINVVA